MIEVIGFGAGGHAKVVIDLLRAGGRFEIVGLLDPNPRLRNASVLGVPVLGGDDLVPSLYERGVRDAFIGVGAISSTWPRRRLFDLALQHGLNLVTAVHPSAVISPSAKIGRGATVMAGVVVNAEAVVGENVILNTGSIIEHDCTIGDHAHVASGARLAGGAVVGEGAQIGIGAVVRQGIRIGRLAMVGAGSVVVDDVPDSVVVVGVPARVLRPVEESWSI